MPSAELDVQEQTLVGLRLPDGTEIWPGETWHGRGVETPEDRQVIVEAIRASAPNMGIDEGLLLTNYHWLIRVDTSYTVNASGIAEAYAIDTPSLLESPEVVDAEVVNGEADSFEDIISEVIPD